MYLAGLFQYPLKSGRAIARQAADIRLDGMSGDRRLMLVDDKGQGVTQRDLPALAAVVASVEGDQATLHFGGNQVSASFEPTRRLSVTVWSSPVDAALAPEAVNATLSGWFGQSLRLVQMDGQAARLAGGDWAGAPVPVGFADEYPLLVTTTGSLAALNATLAERGEPAVGMDRFRTNLLIAHDVPWDEDLWEAVEIGGVRIDLVKPCTRCIVTTQDQETGARTGGNPIPALSRTRMSGDRRVVGVLFGWNAVPRGEGRLSVGEPVRVLFRRAEAWPMRQPGQRRESA